MGNKAMQEKEKLFFVLLIILTALVCFVILFQVNKNIESQNNDDNNQDASGTFESEESIDTESFVDVIDNPVLIGIRDRIVAFGDRFLLSENIMAFDVQDGDITEKISIKYEELDWNTEGSYTIFYSIEDSDGNKTELASQIMVVSPETYEELYYIENTDQIYITSEEMKLLIERDYFKYVPLEQEDYEAACELVCNALVNMIFRVDAENYTFGSGFIYKIDSDDIYIVSDLHVLNSECEVVELMFGDDEGKLYSLSPPVYYQIEDGQELCMFKIDLNAFELSTVLNIKEIYADENIYDELAIGDEIIAYSGHLKNEEAKINNLYIKALDVYFSDEAPKCIETNMNIEGGMSGTAVVDKIGRLVGVVEGFQGVYNYSTENYEYSGYLLRIDGLEEFYERVKNIKD